MPLVRVPETVRYGLAPSRNVWCRAEGVAPGRRDGTGLILRPHTTIQEIDNGQV